MSIPPNTTGKSVIEIVRECRRKIDENPWPILAASMNYVLPMQEMDAIANALIQAEEALKEMAVNMDEPTAACRSREALAALHSPLPE